MKARYFHRRNPLDGYNDADLTVKLPDRDDLDRFEETLVEAIEDALSRKDYTGKRTQINRYERQDGTLGRLGALPFARAVTICVIEDDDRNELARGYAFCSRDDQFNKRVGREIAFGRALAALSPEQREQLRHEEGIRLRKQQEQTYLLELLDRMSYSFGNLDLEEADRELEEVASNEENTKAIDLDETFAQVSEALDELSQDDDSSEEEDGCRR